MAAQNEPRSNDIELVEAELGLARALQHISALRRDALHGIYDSTTFDRAVADYRAAESRLIQTRLRQTGIAPSLPPNRSVTVAHPVPAPAPPLPNEPPAPPIEPTPHLLFARWLVQNGRLSEWGPEGPTSTSV